MDQTLTAVGLAGCVAVVGMPHGGLDHLFGRAALQPAAGRWWRAWFGGLYLGVAGLVVAGWSVAPAATATGFFLVSAYHFGAADGRRGWAGLVEGGAVIWVPLLARPGEAAELLAWVIPGGRPAEVLVAVDSLRPLLMVVAAGFAAHVFMTVWRGEVATAVRLLAFAGLFAVLPVLVGFGLFFCGWHSTREMWGLARRADPARPARGLATVVWLAAPRAAAAVVAAGAAAWWFADGRDLTPVVVQAVFLGLSAVAVPHILLHALADRLGADPFARRTDPCPTAATT
jgi:Brp/Blh family beta-carotene 15,15'-monooxygenase